MKFRNSARPLGKLKFHLTDPNLLGASLKLFYLIRTIKSIYYAKIILLIIQMLNELIFFDFPFELMLYNKTVRTLNVWFQKMSILATEGFFSSLTPTP